MATDVRRSRRPALVAVGAVLLVAVSLGASSSSSSVAGKAPVSNANHLAAVPVTAGPPPTTIPMAITSTTTPSSPLVRHVTPANKAQQVRFHVPVVVTYDRAPGPSAPLPTISPSTPGQWQQVGDQLVFRPTSSWQMGTTYRVSIPGAGGSPAVRATPSGVVKFTTALPSVLLLQQYLAMLGYLPLRFTPAGVAADRKAALAAEPTTPTELPTTPLAGSFSWAYGNIPSSLSGQWAPGQANELTSAAVMQFESAEGLAPDGDAGVLVWHALLNAIAKRQMDPNPYNYVIVSEALPETLYVWQDGQFVYNTLTNTGVPGADTPQGTWPVVYKQNPNLMKGCDVNGYCYSVWVAYASYFLPSVGDAIHAYPRGGYGYPQSNGCVEVSPAVGATVYSYDPVGTLVTVNSWVGPAQ